MGRQKAARNCAEESGRPGQGDTLAEVFFFKSPEGNSASFSPCPTARSGEPPGKALSQLPATPTVGTRHSNRKGGGERERESGRWGRGRPQTAGSTSAPRTEEAGPELYGAQTSPSARNWEGAGRGRRLLLFGGHHLYELCRKERAGRGKGVQGKSQQALCTSSTDVVSGSSVGQPAAFSTATGPSADQACFSTSAKDFLRGGGASGVHSTRPHARGFPLSPSRQSCACPRTGLLCTCQSRLQTEAQRAWREERP